MLSFKTMKNKFVCFCIFISFLTVKSFSLSICDLMRLALEYNSEINDAKTNYEKKSLSSKNLNGSYIPNIALSSSIAFPKDYKWDTSPEAFSSGIIYSNLLPGGTTISIETGYAFNCISISDERVLNQTPYITLSLSQSLLPFWVQGEAQDPIRLSSKQQNEFYRYQLLYIKKKVMMEIFQNYIFALISKKEIEMNENTLAIYEKQIESLKLLKSSGYEAQAKILEIENSKWSILQNIMSAQSKYTQQIQNLKTLCGKKFNENYIESLIDTKFENELMEILEFETAPLEHIYKLKLEILKTERILEKQMSAPTLSFSIQPNLRLSTTKVESWKNAWETFEEPYSWNFNIGLNLSPMFTGIAKQNNQKYQLDYNNAETTYNSYLAKREFIKEQYKTLLEYYLQQKKTICKLYDLGIRELQDYKIQYEAKMISKLDFDSIKTRIENYKLSKECVDLYIWLYEMMMKFE